ncbi:MAG: sulfate ABC transporter substrate-binding protein, partial [Nostoc sp.]
MSESQQPTQVDKFLIEGMQVYALKALQSIQLWYQHTIRSWLNRCNVQSFVSLFLIGTFLSVAVASCSGSSSASKGDVKLKLVS